MRVFIAILLLLGAHFSLTAFVPAEAGKAWILWPFAADSQPLLKLAGGLPEQSGSVLTPLLAGVAGLGFLAAFAGLFGLLVAAQWWTPLVIIAACASIALYILYAGVWSLLPIAIDLLIIWGVLLQYWPQSVLRGT